MMYRMIKETTILSVFLFLVVICLLMGSNMVKEVPVEEEEIMAWCGTTGIVSTPEMDLGKALFKANCATCHNKNMKDDMTGPALGGVRERWAEYPSEDLYAWIRNSEALAKAGHPLAKKLYKDWSPTTMTAFPNLTNEEIDGILAYVHFGSAL